MTEQEKKLREAIRKEIKKELNEIDFLKRANPQAGKRMKAAGKTSPIRMLKNILGTGSPDKRAAGLAIVISTLLAGEGDGLETLQKLKQRLQSPDIRQQIAGGASSKK